MVWMLVTFQLVVGLILLGITFDLLKQVDWLKSQLQSKDQEVQDLKFRLRSAPMPLRESILDADVWDESYSLWWHQSASERALGEADRHTKEGVEG